MEEWRCGSTHSYLYQYVAVSGRLHSLAIATPHPPYTMNGPFSVYISYLQDCKYEIFILLCCVRSEVFITGIL
jgi:hypothetical protein